MFKIRDERTVLIRDANGLCGDDQKEAWKNALGASSLSRVVDITSTGAYFFAEFPNGIVNLDTIRMSFGDNVVIYLKGDRNIPLNVYAYDIPCYLVDYISIPNAPV